MSESNSVGSFIWTCHVINVGPISWNPFSRELARTMLRFEDAEQAGLEAGKNWVETGFKKALVS